MNNFFNLLKEKKLKATPQRISLLQELQKKTHPNIDDLYGALKQENPLISLATVYKNIATLKEKGMVSEVNVPEDKTRYDIVHKPHIHIFCTQCNTIQDVEYGVELYAYQVKLEKAQDIKIEKLDLMVTVNSCFLCKR